MEFNGLRVKSGECRDVGRFPFWAGIKYNGLGVVSGERCGY
jgi:hypothetical protein